LEAGGARSTLTRVAKRKNKPTANIVSGGPERCAQGLGWHDWRSQKMQKQTHYVAARVI
jgi:hypothetical protein